MLHNPRLPLVEANAAYLAVPASAGAAAPWLRERGRPACLIGTTDCSGNFLSTRLLLEQHDAAHPGGEWQVEQAGWASSDALAHALLAGSGLEDWQGIVAAEIGRVVREDRDTILLLAYQHGRVAGGCLLVEGQAHLVAGGPQGAARGAVLGAAAALAGGTVLSSRQAATPQQGGDRAALVVSVPRPA